MRTLVSYVLSVCLIIVFSLSAADTAFSQTAHVDTTGAASSKNEGTSTYVKGITSSRAKSLVGSVVGLVSLIIGWRSKARYAVNRSGSRNWAIASLVFGLAAIGLSLVHLSTVSGGFGTGGGRAGAIVGLLLGFIGAALGGLALRSKAKE